MSKPLSDRINHLGSSVKGLLKSVEKSVAKGVDASVEYVIEKAGVETDEGKDFGIAGIKEQMDVLASCGKKVGVVDSLEAGHIKLTRIRDTPHQLYFIPFSWIGRVDGEVHLNRDFDEIVSKGL